MHQRLLLRNGRHYITHSCSWRYPLLWVNYTLLFFYCTLLYLSITEYDLLIQNTFTSLLFSGYYGYISIIFTQHYILYGFFYLTSASKYNSCYSALVQHIAHAFLLICEALLQAHDRYHLIWLKKEKELPELSLYMPVIFLQTTNTWNSLVSLFINNYSLHFYHQRHV